MSLQSKMSGMFFSGHGVVSDKCIVEMVSRSFNRMLVQQPLCSYAHVILLLHGFAFLFILYLIDWATRGVICSSH